jgi:hypothetical protein
VLAPLLCCLKGIWVHPYTIPSAKLSPKLGILVHLGSKTDVIYLCLRLNPPQTTVYIHIRHTQSVWAIGMMSQGHMGAPLRHYTGQVGPRFGNSGSLVKRNWCHYVMFGAYIHYRPLPTSTSDIQRVLAIAMLSQGYLGVPFYHHSSQVGPIFGQLASLVEWEWCHILMVEANIHLRLLHTFILDIYKVFEQLLCCLKGICVHP